MSVLAPFALAGFQPIPLLPPPHLGFVQGLFTPQFSTDANLGEIVLPQGEAIVLKNDWPTIDLSSEAPKIVFKPADTFVGAQIVAPTVNPDRFLVADLFEGESQPPILRIFEPRENLFHHVSGHDFISSVGDSDSDLTQIRIWAQALSGVEFEDPKIAGLRHTLGLTVAQSPQHFSGVRGQIQNIQTLFAWFDKNMEAWRDELARLADIEPSQTAEAALRQEFEKQLQAESSPNWLGAAAQLASNIQTTDGKNWAKYFLLHFNLKSHVYDHILASEFWDHASEANANYLTGMMGNLARILHAVGPDDEGIDILAIAQRIVRESRIDLASDHPVRQLELELTPIINFGK